MERVKDTDDIKHPAIREAMKFLDMQEIRLTYEADLPARSGLGTSSSFAVGMLNAFYALKGKYADKKKLADEAIYLERVLCNEAGGWQDQIAASFGGFNRINFNTDGTYDVLQPLHPYGVSKVGQDLISFQYFMNDHIRCIRARIFNSTGTRKVNDVTSDFTKRAVEAEKTSNWELKVGNLDTKRAIMDQRDLVKGLMLLAEKKKARDTIA